VRIWELGGLGWESKTGGLETRGTKNAGTPSDHTSSLDLLNRL